MEDCSIVIIGAHSPHFSRGGGPYSKERVGAGRDIRPTGAVEMEGGPETLVTIAGYSPHSPYIRRRDAVDAAEGSGARDTRPAGSVVMEKSPRRRSVKPGRIPGVHGPHVRSRGAPDAGEGGAAADRCPRDARPAGAVVMEDCPITADGPNVSR